MPASLTVVICSLNGARGVERCLRALRAQTIASALEVVVVDDGSTDETGDVAAAGGAITVRHSVNRGSSAARNSGIALASAEFVAFIDDDCEPAPDWAENLIDAYDVDVVGVGGSLSVGPGPGVVLNYLARNNPLACQELELAVTNRISYRFWIYIRRQWAQAQPHGRRSVVALPSANLSIRRQALIDIGGFDERIHFGSEDEDLCYRLRQLFPDKSLLYEPAARVIHHFEPTLRDTMRRSRIYGRGSAIMFRKWADVGPTFFPFPLVILALLVMSFQLPALVVIALALPQLFYPQGVRAAARGHGLACLLDPYLQLIQEACDNLGFLEGMWMFRRLPSEIAKDPVRPIEPRKDIQSSP